jgi:hypothetical protein
MSALFSYARICGWNPMRVGVDRDLNRAVSELVPHVREALALLNQMGCVRVAFMPAPA